MLFESLHLLFRAMNKPGDKLEDFLMSKTNRGCSTFFPFSTLLLPPYSDIPTFYHVLHIKYRPKEGKGGQPLIQKSQQVSSPFWAPKRDYVLFSEYKKGRRNWEKFWQISSKMFRVSCAKQPWGAEQGYC